MKILVVRYRFIGDTILSVPFLRNLRKAYPDAQIDMLVGPVSGEVLQGCPYVDNFIVFDTTKKHRYEESGENPRSFLSYVNLLRKNKYDKAYVLKRSFSSAALVFLAGIKERIGFDTENRGFFLTKPVPYYLDKHEIECFLDLLRADEIDIEDNHLEYWPDRDAKFKINSVIREKNPDNKPMAVVHATSGNPDKEWPYDNVAKVVEYLVNIKSVQVFHIGASCDSEVYDRIRRYIQTDLEIEPVNLCGQLSIQENMALISKMNFVIGSDSGILHMAAAVNTPVIGIYGPMNHEKWHVFGDQHVVLYGDLPCIPCDLKIKCPYDIACLKEITPMDVTCECNAFLFGLNNEEA